MNKLNDSKSIPRRKAIALIGLGGLALQFPFACTSKSKKASIDNETLHYLSISEVSQLIKSKEISCVALTEHMLDRIKSLDSKLNSFIHVMSESALKKAQLLDDEIEQGKYRGPMHGIPIGIKDLFYSKGVKTTGGLAVRSNFTPDYDATVVSQLEEAGAIVLGKLNLTEGALIGYHKDFKIPVNPWNELFAVGGSSSGSGVATAAGLCFASLGTDTGGSIRVPSAANGVVGLKPTYGLVSRYGVHALGESLDHIGPMTRNVSDAALMLEVMARHDIKDITSLDIKPPNILSSLDGKTKGMKLGYNSDFAMEGTDKGLAESISSAKQAFEKLGVAIVDVKMPSFTIEHFNIWVNICSYEALMAHKNTFPSNAENYGKAFKEFLEIGLSVTEKEYLKMKADCQAYSFEFNKALESVDAVLCPSGYSPGLAKEQVGYGSLVLPSAEYASYFRFTFPSNFAGTPTLTLPCGFNNDGVPYGMQLMGNKFGERELCRLGFAYEQSTEWHKRHPKI